MGSMENVARADGWTYHTFDDSMREHLDADRTVLRYTYDLSGGCADSSPVLWYAWVDCINSGTSVNDIY